jgi:hypothetical protein
VERVVGALREVLAEAGTHGARRLGRRARGNEQIAQA